MKSKKKIRRKKSVRMRGHPELEVEEGQLLELDEELNNEFFELNKPDDFDVEFKPEEESDW